MINTLMQGGAPTTTFQPVLFMDNLLTNWARRDILENNIYTYPHFPDLEATWICLDDVAKFMVAAIERDDLIGRRIVIGGPETFTPQRVADMLSGHFGRSIKYEFLSLEDFADLASDELTGGYDVVKGERVKIQGYLEDFALSKKEADELIMGARDIVYKN